MLGAFGLGCRQQVFEALGERGAEVVNPDRVRCGRILLFGVPVAGRAGEMEGVTLAIGADPPVGVMLHQMVASAIRIEIVRACGSAHCWVGVIEGFSVIEVAAEMAMLRARPAGMAPKPSSLPGRLSNPARVPRPRVTERCGRRPCRVKVREARCPARAGNLVWSTDEPVPRIPDEVQVAESGSTRQLGGVSEPETGITTTSAPVGVAS